MASVVSSLSSKAVPSCKVILKSAEGDLFEVEKEIVNEWQVVNFLIADDCADSLIPLPNISSRNLALIIEFCRKDMEFSSSSPSVGIINGERKSWEDYFDFDVPIIFYIVLAARYLDFSKLLKIGNRKIADMMRGKTDDEIRQRYHIRRTEEENTEMHCPWEFE